MTKIKIDIESSDKITNASVQINYDNGATEIKEIISEPTKVEEKPKPPLLNTSDKVVIPVKSGVNSAFLKSY